MRWHAGLPLVRCEPCHCSRWRRVAMHVHATRSTRYAASRAALHAIAIYGSFRWQRCELHATSMMRARHSRRVRQATRHRRLIFTPSSHRISRCTSSHRRSMQRWRARRRTAIRAPATPRSIGRSSADLRRFVHSCGGCLAVLPDRAAAPNCCARSMPASADSEPSRSAHERAADDRRRRMPSRARITSALSPGRPAVQHAPKIVGWSR